MSKEKEKIPSQPKEGDGRISRRAFTGGVLGSAALGLLGGYLGNEAYRNLRDGQKPGVPSGTNDGIARVAELDRTPTPPKGEQLTPKAVSLLKSNAAVMAEAQATPTATGTPPKVEVVVQQSTVTQARVPERTTQTSTPTPARIPTATEMPTAEPTKIKEIIKSGISLVNIAEKVDSKVQVDIAKGVFKNTVGLGTEAFIAEPGGLLVGPDFETKSKLNPYGENPAGWEAMYKAGGSIKPFSAVSQEVIRWPGEAHQNLPEGGFVFISAGQMTVEIGDVKLKMPYKKGHNYFFVSRGIYADNKQDTDENRSVKLTEYKPGFVEVTMYESREKTNTAFI